MLHILLLRFSYRFTKCENLIYFDYIGNGGLVAQNQVFQDYSNDLAGILPFAKTRSRWDAWRLPGHGEVTRETCGHLFWKGCLETHAHFGEHQGKGYAKRARRCCRKASCPMCYEKWAFLEGHRAVRRISQYVTRMKPIHVIISPGVRDMELSYDALKDKMYSIAKAIGIVGGLAIIHPFRSICKLCQKDKDHCDCGEAGVYEWYVSPHFHLVCYGWVKGEVVGSIFESEGWVCKNLGVRQSVASTIGYQLSHAGVHMPESGSCSVHGSDHVACRLANKFPFPNPPDCEIVSGEKKKATVVWFGALSYNKLKVDKSVMDEKDRCILCNGELREIRFTMCDLSLWESQFKENDEVFLDPEGWEYKPKVGWYG